MLTILLGLVPTILGLVRDYQAGKITEAQLEAQLQQALYEAYTTIYTEAQKTFRVALKSEDSYVRRAWPTAFYFFLGVHAWFVIVQPMGHSLGQHFDFWFPILKTSDVLLADNKYFLGAMLGIGAFLPAKNGRSFVSRAVGAVRGMVKGTGIKGQ